MQVSGEDEMGGEKVQDAVLSFAGEIASAYEADGTEKSKIGRASCRERVCKQV